MSEIPSIPSDGNTTAILAPAVAGKAPTVAEVTAASLVDISCYLTGDGLNLTTDQATIQDERLCSTQTYEKPGRKTNTAEVTYIDNSNSEFEDTDNAAAEALIEGSTHFLITRRGVPYETPFEAGQKVSVWPIQCGAPREVPPEANSVIRTTQKLFVTGEVRQRVEITA